MKLIILLMWAHTLDVFIEVLWFSKRRPEKLVSYAFRLDDEITKLMKLKIG